MEGRFALNEEIEVRLLAPKPLCEANAERDYMVRALAERLKVADSIPAVWYNKHSSEKALSSQTRHFDFVALLLHRWSKG